MVYKVFIMLTLQGQVEGRGGIDSVPSLMPGECPCMSLEDIDMCFVGVTQSLKHEVVPPGARLRHVPQIEEHRLSHQETMVLVRVVLHCLDCSMSSVPGGHVPG